MAPSNLPSIFNATSQDIEMLLAAQCHVGSKNLQVHMEPYLWKTRPDGVNIINIGKTWYEALDDPPSHETDCCFVGKRSSLPPASLPLLTIPPTSPLSLLAPTANVLSSSSLLILVLLLLPVASRRVTSPTISPAPSRSHV